MRLKERNVRAGADGKDGVCIERSGDKCRSCPSLVRIRRGSDTEPIGLDKGACPRQREAVQKAYAVRGTAPEVKVQVVAVLPYGKP
jgi:hypothetical protein